MLDEGTHQGFRIETGNQGTNPPLFIAEVPFSFSRIAERRWLAERTIRLSASTYTMSLSHSAQMFCPGGRLDCGVDGCWGFVSGAETGLSPVRAGEDGVTTPLCAVGSAISQRSYRTGMHQADWSRMIQSKNHWRAIFTLLSALRFEDHPFHVSRCKSTVTR